MKHQHNCLFPSPAVISFLLAFGHIYDGNIFQWLLPIICRNSCPYWWGVRLKYMCFCHKDSTVCPEGVVGGHGVKLEFLNFNFRVTDIESTDYVAHGTDFIVFQLQKMSSPEPFKVGQICTFRHFHLKMANIFY